MLRPFRSSPSAPRFTVSRELGRRPRVTKHLCSSRNHQPSTHDERCWNMLIIKQLCFVPRLPHPTLLSSLAYLATRNHTNPNPPTTYTTQPTTQHHTARDWCSPPPDGSSCGNKLVSPSHPSDEANCHGQSLRAESRQPFMLLTHHSQCER